MPIFEYKCPVCGYNEDVLIPPAAPDERWHCKKCPKFTWMEKQPSRASFTIRGYNASNGYSKDKS